MSFVAETVRGRPCLLQIANGKSQVAIDSCRIWWP